MSSTSYHLRFSARLQAKVKTAANHLETSEQHIVRMATEIGLVHLARINYQIPEAIVDRARKAKAKKKTAKKKQSK